MEDTNIVDLFLQRDEVALSETANKYGKKLHKFSYGIVDSDEDADECVNDTYLSAWNAIPPNEPRTYLFAFLMRIVRHISFDCVKRRNRQKRSATVITLSEELFECIPYVENNFIDTYENVTESINLFLAEIEQSMRIVFVRRYFYMDSIKTIATNYGYTESKVTSMLYRTRNALRKYLENRGISV